MQEVPEQPTALQQAEQLQEQLNSLEGALNGIHSLQVVYWPTGDIFRASGTAPGTVISLRATKAALLNLVAQLDAQIVDAAVQEAKEALAAEEASGDPE